jgi:glycosyltransferase involved in cell wall biosynthesis
MIPVVIIHQGFVQHYRCGIYNYLADYLQQSGYLLSVVSNRIQKGYQGDVRFDFKSISLTTKSLIKFLYQDQAQAVMYFVNPKNLYLLPTIMACKMLGKKVVYWGHGKNLLRNPDPWRWVHVVQHHLADAIVLYGPKLRKHVMLHNWSKVFVANNTLNFESSPQGDIDRQRVLARHNINTSLNVICVGRIQKRKRIDDLIAAHQLLKRNDVGLVFVGPDPQGLVPADGAQNIFRIEPLFDEQLYELMRACDIYCLPGSVGLGIVDAFWCGLPFVTEAVRHGPEIMYFREGINGFMVPKGDISALAEKLERLIEDPILRKSFGQAGKDLILEEGNIELMCSGFLAALDSLKLKKRGVK